MYRVALSVTGNEDAANRMMSDRRHTVTRWLCYEESVEAFHRHCFNLGEVGGGGFPGFLIGEEGITRADGGGRGVPALSA